MKKIEIYTSEMCSFCHQAKLLLKKKKVLFKEIKIDNDIEKRKEMINRSNRKTVPQIFIDNQHIGGCDDLYNLEKNRKLDFILKKNKNFSI
ncbi:glutaredoxin 3 [Candidatus Tachikawaea gelatinosa]|nr:glutaredoxin 3 [Candidatus Tachikawaea gelatinosa]